MDVQAFSSVIAFKDFVNFLANCIWWKLPFSMGHRLVYFFKGKISASSSGLTQHVKFSGIHCFLYRLLLANNPVNPISINMDSRRRSSTSSVRFDDPQFSPTGIPKRFKRFRSRRHQVHKQEWQTDGQIRDRESKRQAKNKQMIENVKGVVHIWRIRERGQWFCDDRLRLL